MSRLKNKNKKRKRKWLLLLLTFIVVFFYSINIYGEYLFYVMKSFAYEKDISQIKINTYKNDDLEKIDLNFSNEGTCDVYLRCFVFVYNKNEENMGTTISNASIKINYGDENYWFIGQDNYVYYTKPLKIGETTKDSMIKSIDINLSENDKELLQNYDLGIDIVTEAVQVSNFAYKHEWDMENVDIEDLYNGNEISEIKLIVK